MSSSGVELKLDLMVGEGSPNTTSLAGQSMGLLLALTYTN